MPGRKINPGSYRYSFNGKENDPETGTQDYGLRIYDGRIAKFLSVDPLTVDFPFYTPYQFAGNKPIWAIDLDGAEELPTNNGTGGLPTINGQTGPFSQEYIDQNSNSNISTDNNNNNTPKDKRDFRVSAGGPLPYPLNFTSNFGLAFYKTLYHNSGSEFYDYNSLGEYWNVWGRQDEPSASFRPLEFSIENLNGSWNTLSLTFYHYKQHVSNIFHPSGGVNEMSLNYTYESAKFGTGKFSKHLSAFAGAGIGVVLTNPTVHGDYDQTHHALQVGPKVGLGYQLAGKAGSTHLGIMVSFKLFKRFNYDIYAMGQAHYLNTRTFTVVENSTGNVAYKSNLESFGIGGSIGTRLTYNIGR